MTSLVTAVTAIGALVFTALSLNSTRDQVAIAEQSQFTDRYSKAVEQLGQSGVDRLQVRLGGIYALERLAHDSPRDQPTIVEVLSAFIRTTTPMPTTTTPIPIATIGNRIVACPLVEQDVFRPDVQAAITVLGRRVTAHDDRNVIDLSLACLGSITLSGNLSGADLTGTNLWRASLTGADLSDADLSDADLTDANLAGATLTGASLTRAGLAGADLARADLSGANLSWAYHDDQTLTPGAIRDEHTRGAWW